jgi:hypothetical protein
MPAELKQCPFCGGTAAQHPSPTWRNEYRVIYHKAGCFLSNGKPPYNFTLLPPCCERSWNRRADTVESLQTAPNKRVAARKARPKLAKRQLRHT